MENEENEKESVDVKNIVSMKYRATGEFVASDALGMREMQSIAYKQRGARFHLIKAPPASGKSRALMFIGLAKLAERQVEKVVVAVPQMAIGSSFAETNLIENGFFANWKPDVDLTRQDVAVDKRDSFMRFLQNREAKILICAHATLRNVFESLEKTGNLGAFNNCLVAVDEFH
ncbi:MAG: DEAD/DEAH box helicase family protein, partial [Thermoguttaceae bacterium]|nr:DEAD/DEAH box helicase family protein [Thermoguttaceae bacterium]